MSISSLEGIVSMGDLVRAVSVHELFGPWSSRLGMGRPGVLQSTGVAKSRKHLDS